jgi:hypothetical protein
MTFAGISYPAILLAAIAVLGLGADAQTPQAPPAPQTRGGPASTALNYVPGVGDLMTCWFSRATPSSGWR